MSEMVGLPMKQMSNSKLTVEGLHISRHDHHLQGWFGEVSQLRDFLEAAGQSAFGTSLPASVVLK